MKLDAPTVAVLVLVLLIVGGGGSVAVYQATRGLRNNNPGNIRRDGTRWEGMSPDQTDAAFVQFVAPEYGLRAMARVLNSYYTRHQLRTVRGIITRWAPPNENDTGAYVRSVASRLNVGPDDALSWPDRVPELIEAIVKHENGLQPYSREMIAQGITLAEIGWSNRAWA